jgi:hypothetical protein
MAGAPGREESIGRSDRSGDSLSDSNVGIRVSPKSKSHSGGRAINVRRAVIMSAAVSLAAIAGLGAQRAGAQCCGDCDGQNGVTVDEVVTAVTHVLEQPCSDDMICSAESCPARLAACQSALAQCQSQTGSRRLPASGQTTSYGTGSDGAVRAGAPLSYRDNGDGTITDNNTGLMWEKQDDAGGIHDKDNRYTWGMEAEPYTMDGTMVTELLAVLNTPPCFAGHCDWRIPNVKELHSIVDYEIPSPGPMVRPVFDTGCVEGCTVDGSGGPTCSCITASDYWSSTSDADSPDRAWTVDYDDGFVDDDRKANHRRVRAVRGGE